MKCVKVLIIGVVQGVGFRSFLVKNAELLDIKGYVKNIEDKVEAVFQGNKNSIDKMLKVCNSGPENAKVEAVNVKEEDINEFDDFRIEY